MYRSYFALRGTSGSKMSNSVNLSCKVIVLTLAIEWLISGMLTSPDLNAY